MEASLLKKISSPKIRSHLDSFQKLFIKSSQLVQQQGLPRDMSMECGVCGIVVNEIEGLLSENLTQAQMEEILQQDLCSLFSGPLNLGCDVLVDQLPLIISKIENIENVGVICVDLGFCQTPFKHHVDPMNIPQYVINLDLPPKQRLSEVCSNSTFQSVVQYLLNTITGILPDGGKDLAEIGRMLNQYYFPTEYAEEIQGCCQLMDVDVGWITLLNLAYEVTDACTSIVCETTDGHIYHARNLDFWDGMGFTASLKDIAYVAVYQKGGETLFYATTFAGYAGVLSGMRPNSFSISVDTRFYPQGIAQLFYEVIAAIEEHNASLVTFLTREVMTNENTFNSAIDNLSNDELVADVYYIVGGVNSGEGAVISRNRINATDVWRLDVEAGRWFLVETNYDHWKQPPWFDNRVTPANDAMNAMGQKDISYENLFNVLSVKPVFNLQTAVTILTSAGLGTFQAQARYCPYPCVE